MKGEQVRRRWSEKEGGLSYAKVVLIRRVCMLYVRVFVCRACVRVGVCYGVVRWCVHI